MGSSGESENSLRLKNLDVEGKLINEKINLYELNKKYARMKLHWEKQVKVAKENLVGLEEELKMKEETLASLKEKLYEMFINIRKIEEAAEREEKKRKALEREFENKKDIRKELRALQEMKRSLRLSTSWVKEFEEYEAPEGEKVSTRLEIEKNFPDLGEEVEEKMKIYDNTVREFNERRLEGLRQKMEDLQDQSAKLQEEYEKLVEKNREIERKIIEMEEEAEDPQNCSK